MTRLDDLPSEVEKVADLVRSVCGREIDKARKALAVLKADESTARTTLSTVQTQLKQAQADLKATNAHQGKASDLVSLRYETAEKQKTLDALNARIEKATTETATAEEKLADLERKVTEATTTLEDVRLERADAYADIDRARALANGWRTA
jgi:predicted  nucleic acid-binding Zn-ribbon protein